MEYQITYVTGDYFPWRVRWRKPRRIFQKAWRDAPYPYYFGTEEEAEQRIRDLVEKPARIVPPFKFEPKT